MFRTIIGAFLILTQSLFAQALTISGDVRDASDTPLNSNSVTFEFSILNPAQTCVLYRETHLRDMSASGGFFSAELGAGSSAYNGNTTLENVFANAGSLNCEGGGSYSPTATDRRLVKIGFNAGSGWRYVSDLVPITQAAWAMHSKSSENSLKLNGLSASSYLLKPGAACAGVVGFDGTTLTCSPIASLAVDWSSLTNKPSTFAPSAHTHPITQITSNSAGDYFNYTPNGTACVANEIRKWDGSRWICGADNAGTPGITALTGDVTASGSGSVPVTVGSIGGKTAAQVASAVDDIATVPTTYLARSGGTMTGAIDMNQQNMTNTGHITMYPSKTLHLSNNASSPAGSFTGADSGKVWYNSVSNKLEYWDGSSVKNVGVEGGSASDLTSITGTGIVQRTGAASYSTLGIGSDFIITGGITLDLTNSGVTAGSYSKVTVDSKGRVTLGTNLSPSDITTALGYAPLNKAGDVMSGSLGLGNFSNATESALIGSFSVGDKGKTWFNTSTNQVKYWDGAVAQAIGISIPVLPVSSGGTGVTNLGSGNLLVGAGSGAVTSLNSGLAGNVVYATGTSSWASGTPDTAGLVDKSSTQTISGAKAFGNSIQMLAQNQIRFADADSSNFVALRSPPALASNVIWTLPMTDGSSGQVLSTDGFGQLSWSSVAGGGISNINGITAATQSFAVGSAGTAPNWISTGSIHTMNIPIASAAGVNAGLLSNADYNTFAAKIDSGYPFTGGDLSGTLAAPSVNKIRGVNVDSTSPFTGQVLTYDGGQWRPQAPYTLNSHPANTTLAAPDGIAGVPTFRTLKRNDIKSVISGDFFGNTTCSAGQALVYLSASDQIICQNIMISDSNIDPSRALWPRNGANIHWPTGNVGIGTSTPAVALDVVGTTQTTSLTLNNGTAKATISTLSASDYTVRLPAGLPGETRMLAMTNVGNIIYATPEPYVHPSLMNGYFQAVSGDAFSSLPLAGAAPSTIAYWKDASGMVHLKGVFKGGSPGSPLFQLPAGYIPSGVRVFPTPTDSGTCKTFIYPNGNVTPNASCSTWGSLDGISFRADM